MKHTITLDELLFFKQKTIMASSSKDQKRLYIIAKTSMNTEQAIAHYEVINLKTKTIYCFNHLKEAINKYNKL